MSESRKPVTRREFARNAALSTAALIVYPDFNRGAESCNFSSPSSFAAGASAAQAPNAPKLSAQSQAEAEARWQSIIAQYGERFSEAQKTDLHRLSIFLQPSLDRIRAYPVSNSNLPALFLKPLVERDKKPSAISSSQQPSPSPEPAKAKR